MSNKETESNKKGVNNTDQNSNGKNKNKKTNSFKIIIIAVLVIIIIIGGYYGIKEFSYYQNHVSTNDAQTNGHISPVLSRVSGYVVKVYVNDNEQVKQGQLLV